MKSKITVKLSLYFSAVLILFAVIIGIIFITLFQNQTISQMKDDLETKAVSIAATLSDYMSSTSSTGSGSGNGRGQMGSGLSGYSVYLRVIDDIAMTDVWLVDENLQLITGNQTAGIEYNYSDLPDDAETVVSEVFSGKTTFSEGFSSLLNAPTLTVGTPITVDDEIIGAVLLHSSVDGMEESTVQGIKILLVSMLIALLLSFLLSIFFAYSFVKPLTKMKNSTLLLAGGDYHVKTGVLQNDEIGDLAAAIDSLSIKLDGARQESEKLDKLRRDFVANVSHELRTPITVMRGSIEALSDEIVKDPEQIKIYYRQMLNESIFLQRLVNDLLDLSRLQNTDFNIEMQELNLCDVIRDASRSARQIAIDKNITIQLDFDKPAYPFTGDYGRLRQMFLIILDNAVKFSPPDSTVNVSMKDHIVSIHDQGQGIAPDDLPFIFDRFYKVKSEDNKNGSGLGLSIAKQIADRHNIDMAVDSHLGAGTTFLFKF